MNQSRRPGVIPTLAALAVAAWLLPAPPAFAASTNGCLSTRSFSDFNGDGYDDAAVGDPYATVDGVAEAGAVTVLLGGPDGRIGEGSRQVITQASFGDTPEAGDHFGYDVFLARTSHSSGCADLLIGAPGEDLSGGADAGMAYLVSDLPDAEGTPTMDVFALTQAGAKGTVEAGDQFGSTVAITNPVDDSHLLVIGAPGENAGSIVDAGAANLWRLDKGPVGWGSCGRESWRRGAPCGCPALHSPVTASARPSRSGPVFATRSLAQSWPTSEASPSVPRVTPSPVTTEPAR